MINIESNQAVGKIRYRSVGDPEEMISTIGFSFVADTDPTELAQALAQGWLKHWKLPSLGPQWSFVGTQVLIGPPEGRSVGEYNMNLAGQGNFSTLPSNCALLVTKITNTVGKGSRGRMFLPAGIIGEAEADQNGFLSGAALSAYQTSATGFLNMAGQDEMEKIVPFNLYHGSTEPGSPLGEPATPITALSVQTQIATQRQRMRR